ncbi:MAG: hypothetical protein AAB391_02150 [Patescibacteria group bacterium]
MRRQPPNQSETADCPLSNIGANYLHPAIQRLSDDGVNVDHFTRLGRDRQFALRMARAFRSGGWSLTLGESEAFDLLGEDRMYLAPEVIQVWNRSGAAIQEDVVWKHRALFYSSHMLRESHPTREPGADWRLFYIQGLSPYAMEVRLNDLGRSPEGHPMRKFYHSHIAGCFRYWQNMLVGGSPKPGYYLLNLNATDLSPEEHWEVHREAKVRHHPASAAIWVEALITDLLMNERSSFKPQESSGAIVGGAWHEPKTPEATGGTLTFTPVEDSKYPHKFIYNSARKDDTKGTIAVWDHDLGGLT